MKIKISNGEYSFMAELYNTQTGNEIFKKLPFETSFTSWGNEIYFSIPVNVSLESAARSTLEVGELGFYPPMSAFCVFFGPTPMSIDDKPQAAGDVNVFGKLLEVDQDKLRNIRGGKIKVEKA